jgi:uncharacterized membrane protein
MSTGVPETPTSPIPEPTTSSPTATPTPDKQPPTPAPIEQSRKEIGSQSSMGISLPRTTHQHLLRIPKEIS